LDNVLWNGRVIKEDDETSATLGLKNVVKKVRDLPQDELDVSTLTIGDGLMLITRLK